MDKCASKDKEHGNVLEYLMKHPIAPLAGAVVLLGSMMADEPVPPQISERAARADPEAVAHDLQPEPAALSAAHADLGHRRQGAARLQRHQRDLGGAAGA